MKCNNPWPGLCMIAATMIVQIEPDLRPLKPFVPREWKSFSIGPSRRIRKPFKNRVFLDTGRWHVTCFKVSCGAPGGVE
jgi:hypothetical protein